MCLMVSFRLATSQTDLIFLSSRKSSWIRTKVKTGTFLNINRLSNCFIAPVLPSISAALAREAELRRLRKANIEFEEQNRVLQKHIKDMYNAKERLEAELGMDEKRTQALHQHLLTIKQTLVSSLSTVPLPGQEWAARVKYKS